MSFNAQMIAFLTLLRKEVGRFVRIWSQTLLPPVITTTLYLLIFGHFIGSYVTNIDGQPYISYIVPGLIMMAIINSAYANVVASFFSAKFQRYIEEMLVSPMPNVLILWGYVSGGVLRSVSVSLLVTLVSLLFTHIQVKHPGLMILVVLLSAILFSLAGLINAIYAKKFDDISIIPTFVLTPLTYLGGVFYSIHLLPPIWQKLSFFNPVLYMINAFRFSMLGTADINIVITFCILIITSLLLYVWALLLLKGDLGVKA